MTTASTFSLSNQQLSKYLDYPTLQNRLNPDTCKDMTLSKYVANDGGWWREEK